MRQWTLQERQRQSEIIRKWQPWAHSTGAKTPEGKAASKMNATKSGAYSQEKKELYRWIRESDKLERDLLEMV